MVREVVVEVAPDEKVLVEGLLRIDDERAVARLRGRGRTREPLGFGVQEVTALVTPVVWLALDEAARKVAGAAVENVGRRSKAWLRRVARRPAAVRVVPPLTAEQLESVRQRVLELGAESGLAAETATALAERVVARLVLPPSQGQLAPEGQLAPDDAHGGSGEPGPEAQGRP
ncbi:hypothetical protein [Streptomyces endophytica]|uniref:Uncharacterized protein n=1 Tax=Streptomyces endophytica TaxID=2991496 RepID=A0ABY6PHA5_9ACTN|nr:hypothetical protein [Streptomyces endophytica]UZJ32825.1 hypothetical protein OJ254_24245 [Streptomyces endophytica]